MDKLIRWILKEIRRKQFLLDVLEDHTGTWFAEKQLRKAELKVLRDTLRRAVSIHKFEWR